MRVFEREERYIVLKLADLEDANLSNLESMALAVVQDKVIAARIASGKAAEITCVVVESDWPEYEPVWEMLEQRITGT